MKRSTKNKSVSKTRSSREKKQPPSRSPQKTKTKKELCSNCSKDLTHSDRALFVEEEIGRTFCSETCISEYFKPEIEKLEKEYFRQLPTHDLSADDRERLAHLRWITLQEPDEIWREKTLSGDFRYTLISEFQPERKRIWSVCICLMLRGEPSFLHLAFTTSNSSMVNHYRKGERVELVKEASKQEDQARLYPQTDGLGEAWTEEETLRAQLTQERKADDISPEDYNQYQSHIEQTLESPDEVWSIQIRDRSQAKLYHFIRHYPEGQPHDHSDIWYIIAARETEDGEQIEILDAFPTRDYSLVEQYRRGTLEVGSLNQKNNSRVVH